MYKRKLTVNERLDVMHSILSPSSQALQEGIKNKLWETFYNINEMLYGEAKFILMNYFDEPEFNELFPLQTRGRVSIRVYDKLKEVTLNSVAIEVLTLYRGKYSRSVTHFPLEWAHYQYSINPDLKVFRLGNVEHILENLNESSRLKKEIEEEKEKCANWIVANVDAYNKLFETYYTVLKNTPKSEDIIKFYPEIEKFLPKESSIKHLPVPFTDIEASRVILENGFKLQEPTSPEPKGRKAKAQAAADKK